MTHRVINKIIYGSREQGFVSDHHASVFNITFYHTVILVQKRLKLPDDFFHQGAEIDLCELSLVTSVLKAGIFEYLVYKCCQTVCLPDNNSGVSVPLQFIFS